MSAVTLWVSTEGEWRHGTTSENVMAVELAGVAVLAAGADQAMITAPDEHPDQIEYVITEFDRDEVWS